MLSQFYAKTWASKDLDKWCRLVTSLSITIHSSRCSSPRVTNSSKSQLMQFHWWRMWTLPWQRVDLRVNCCRLRSISSSQNLRIGRRNCLKSRRNFRSSWLTVKRSCLSSLLTQKVIFSRTRHSSRVWTKPSSRVVRSRRHCRSRSSLASIWTNNVMCTRTLHTLAQTCSWSSVIWSRLTICTSSVLHPLSSCLEDLWRLNRQPTRRRRSWICCQQVWLGSFTLRLVDHSSNRTDSPTVSSS